MHNAPMRLREWLRANTVSDARLAGDLGISPSLARKLRYGQRQPSLPLAVAIEQLTKGAVPARDQLKVGTIAGIRPEA